MKKILFTLMACVLSLGLIGGAFAYFTDVEYSEANVFQAGTLDMQIEDNNECPLNGSVYASFNSPAGLAPGQQFTTDPVTFRNVGSMGIPYIFAKFVITNETQANMAKQFKLVSYGEKSSNGAWVPSVDQDTVDGWSVESFGVDNAYDYLNYWGLDFVDNNDEYITLRNLEEGTPAGASAKTGMWFFDSDGVTTNPACPVGGWAQLRFTFEFLGSATNEYQGDSVTFDVYFVGAQTDADLDASITEY
jgi:predicted ribosomally synthesized peptide with SipW-like signal peptide